MLLQRLPYSLRADPGLDLVEDGFEYGGYSGLSDVALASLPALRGVYAVDGPIPAVVLGH